MDWHQEALIRCTSEYTALHTVVGLKLDLKQDRCVSYDEAFNFAKNNNLTYYEVSSLTGENVKPFIYKFTECIVKPLYFSIFGYPVHLPNESRIRKICQPNNTNSAWFHSITSYLNSASKLTLTSPKK